MATVKKTTEKTTKKTVASKAAAKKTVAVKAEPVKTTKKTSSTAKKYAYIFFNCNDNKDAATMNIHYNNEFFADTAAGRKALLKKVEEEVAAGHVNVSDTEAVKNDILKGEPEKASSKLQYGDIERLVLVA